MKLSIIMPVYNEENTLKKILEKVRNTDIEKEIIIVDDGSTDGTREILKAIKNRNTKVIYHAINMGKGTAVRTALKHITGDIVIIQDADLEYDPQDYQKLIGPIVSGESKVVYGSRILERKGKPYLRYYLGKNFLSLRYRFGNKLLTDVVNLLYHAEITDLYTCYKVFDAKILKGIKLNCKGFEFCPEVTAKMKKQGYRIYEVPISYRPRSIKEGKKITWKDCLKGLYILVRYRFIN